MQTQNPFLDEMAKLSTAAVGLAQAAGEEAKAAFRAQADRMAAEFDLIRRDDFEALKAEVASLRAEVEALRAAAPKAAKASKSSGSGPKTGGDA
jgi:BMFP domain-containing protein YqiC